jgi:hypothetical protein
MKSQPTAVDRKWSFTEKSRNVHLMEISLPRVGDEQFILLQSDVHWDNPHCKRDVWKAHLDEARERDAPILDNGDFFCAMQGKYDPRSSKNDIRPEHVGSNYLDRLIETADKSLAPYADLLTLRGQGNHETSIAKRHETDLTARLTERLKLRGSPACVGGFSGWVRFTIKLTKTNHRSFKLWYHHGYGGGGPVTRGTIQSSRIAVYVSDADVVWNGHTHDAWIMPIERIRLNQENKVEYCRQTHVRTAGYKDEYSDHHGNFGHGGWHIERGGPPKPIGGAWLRFRQVKAGQIKLEIIEAQ